MSLKSTIQINSSKKFPALSEHAFLRYFTFIVLYIAQGIPEGVTIFGIPAWMAMNEISPVAIGGYVAIVMIPFSLKIIAAPWMERFSYLPMGRRRPWLLFGQLGLVLSFLGMSFVPDPLNNLNILTMAVLFVHVFIVFQDISTDSLAIDIVPMHQQPRANGFMWGAKVIGTSTSLAVGTWLINHYGFSLAIMALSAAGCFIILVPFFLRERPGEKLLPWTTGQTSTDSAQLKVDSWAKIFRALKQVFLLPNGLLFIITSFIMLTAFSYIRTLLPIFTIQALGWTNDKYSHIYAITNIVSGIIGMILGCVLIDRFGKIRMMQIYLFLAALFTASMAFSKVLWANIYFTTTYIALFNLLFVLSSIGLFVIAMQFCWKRISALQFTFYMAIYNMGLAAGAALIGRLRVYFEWDYMILAFSVMAILAMFTIRLIHVNNHLQQLDNLEDKYLKKELIPVKIYPID